MTRIKEIESHKRPREKLWERGAEALTKPELLAILLISGTKKKNVHELAKEIIAKHKTDFLDVGLEELSKFHGIEKVKATKIIAAIALVKRFYEEKSSHDTVIKDSKDALLITQDLKNKNKEHLVCLYLNVRGVLLQQKTISIGLVDRSLLHPREIFHPAIELNAFSVILVHNHPSGNPQPSPEDNKIVKRMVKAGDLMGIPILDFLIIARDGYYSFHETYQDMGKVESYVADGQQRSLGDLKTFF